MRLGNSRWLVTLIRSLTPVRRLGDTHWAALSPKLVYAPRALPTGRTSGFDAVGNGSLKRACGMPSNNGITVLAALKYRISIALRVFETSTFGVTYRAYPARNAVLLLTRIATPA